MQGLWFSASQACIVTIKKLYGYSVLPSHWSLSRFLPSSVRVCTSESVRFIVPPAVVGTWESDSNLDKIMMFAQQNISVNGCSFRWSQLRDSNSCSWHFPSELAFSIIVPLEYLIRLICLGFHLSSLGIVLPSRFRKYYSVIIFSMPANDKLTQLAIS